MWGVVGVCVVIWSWCWHWACWNGGTRWMVAGAVVRGGELMVVVAVVIDSDVLV